RATDAEEDRGGHPKGPVSAQRGGTDGDGFNCRDARRHLHWPGDVAVNDRFLHRHAWASASVSPCPGQSPILRGSLLLLFWPVRVAHYSGGDSGRPAGGRIADTFPDGQ